MIGKGRGTWLAAALGSAALFVAAGGIGTAAETCALSDGCEGRVELEIARAQVKPAALPRKVPAPARFAARTEISTEGGTHPSALREAILTMDRDVKVDVAGLPVCHPGHVLVNPPLRACRDTIVGRGRVGISFNSPDNEPVSSSSRLTVFNGGMRRGAVVLLAYTVITVPVPTSLTARIEIRRKPAYGWVARIKIPRIAGGSGSLTDIALNLGRTFSHRGKRRNFLSARCPDGRFLLTMPGLLFKNETEVPGVAAQTVLRGRIAIPCMPRG